MKKFTTRILYSLLLVLIYWALAEVPTALAATFSWEPSMLQAAPGQSFSASLFLDTEGESVNAASGQVLFPNADLVLQNIVDGNSVINFWLEKPALRESQITFSGIIPGGYKGKRALIFTGNFSVNREGSGVLRLVDAKLLLNDGLGTAAAVHTSDAFYMVSPAFSANGIPANSQFLPFINDTEPPEVFTPQIVQTPGLFHGMPFLVFATQDKGSGIDHYEVSEGGGQFQRAESPYLLSSGDARAAVKVAAVDRAGNRRESALQIKPNLLYNYAISVRLAFLIISLALIIVFCLGIKKWLKRRSK